MWLRLDGRPWGGRRRLGAVTRCAIAGVVGIRGAWQWDGERTPETDFVGRGSRGGRWDCERFRGASLLAFRANVGRAASVVRRHRGRNARWWRFLRVRASVSAAEGWPV